MDDKKTGKLKKIIKELGSLIIAFSGGVDSSYLLKIAKNELGKNVIAVTAKFPSIPESEIRYARKIAGVLNCRHIIIGYNQLAIEELRNNHPDRCYHCKKRLFKELISIKDKYGFNFIADGTNYDDLNTYRPGIKALGELGIKSPLADAGLTRKEIIKHSRLLKLPTWNKPSFSCLLSRFPYGEIITGLKLKKVREAESFFHSLGLKHIRVRYHHPIARIETGKEEIPLMSDPRIRGKIIKKLKNTDL